MLPGFSGTLDALTFVGAGHLQRVYVHPHDRSRCIKIMRAELAGTAKEKRYRNTAQRERNYYAFLARRGIAYTHLAKYHGQMRIEHNGHAQLASVFDLIRNDGEEIAAPLDVEIDGKVSSGELADAMHELYLYLIRYNIVSGLKMKNIVVQRLQNTPLKCVLIDNIGNSDFIPLANYANWFARMKMKRRWLRFLQTALKKIPDRTLLKNALQKAWQKAC